MNIDKWIRDKEEWHPEDRDFFISRDDLRELLKDYVIVPKEPTEAMNNEGWGRVSSDDYPHPRDIYKAMIEESKR